jgi:hypothetical protein
MPVDGGKADIIQYSGILQEKVGKIYIKSHLQKNRTTP